MAWRLKPVYISLLSLPPLNVLIGTAGALVHLAPKLLTFPISELNYASHGLGWSRCWWKKLIWSKFGDLKRFILLWSTLHIELTSSCIHGIHTKGVAFGLHKILVQPSLCSSNVGLSRGQWRLGKRRPKRGSQFNIWSFKGFSSLSNPNILQYVEFDCHFQIT